MFLCFLLVDCEWGEWTESKASATCGEAFKTKTRKIIQKAAYGGKQCEGSSFKKDNVQLAPCASKCIILILFQKLLNTL